MSFKERFHEALIELYQSLNRALIEPYYLSGAVADELQRALPRRRQAATNALLMLYEGFIKTL